MFTLFSQRCADLHPYIPGEQPEGDFIKLNANENPYEPAKEVLEELSIYARQNGADFARYPDPESLSLRKAIARMLNESGGFLNAQKSLDFSVTENMIFCSNGSDEVLSFLFYAFFDSDKKLLLPEYTYSFYPVYADYYGIPIQKIPLKSDWDIDCKTMLEDSQHSGGMIFANPNAPTGILLDVDKIEEMLAGFPKNRVMIVDEAYVDFANQSVLPLLQKHKNLVIVRTFSKSFSFAGMRLGFCIAHPELIETVTKVKNSFNHFPVDAFTQRAGQAVCKNWHYYSDIAKTIIHDRRQFSDVLAHKGWEVVPSSANFIMAKKLTGESGLHVYEYLKQKGFLVRYFDSPGTQDYVRITIGTTDDMKKLADIMISM